jgi:hypothetical protein
MCSLLRTIQKYEHGDGIFISAMDVHLRFFEIGGVAMFGAVRGAAVSGWVMDECLPRIFPSTIYLGRYKYVDCVDFDLYCYVLALVC